MPSFRRRASVIDADRVDEPTPAPDGPAAERARALAEEAEAEAAEAEAMAAAARARARALRLRREAATADESIADSGGVTQSDDAEATDASAASEPGDASGAGDIPDTDAALDAGESETGDSGTVGGAPDRRRRPGWRKIAAALCVLAIVALAALSGFMVWNHRQAERLDQQYAEYSAAARQAVVSLMSLDFNNAEADVSRIIDNSTGQFRDDFEGAAQDFVQIAQESQVVTDVTVNAAAVQSMSDDSAEVLVAATSRVTNTTGAEQQPRSWRLAVSLQREGDQIKMSKVEFVP